MKRRNFIHLILFLFLCSCATTRNDKDAKIGTKGSSVKCMENSPERRGEEGCTTLTGRLPVGPLTKPMYWHIDRFDSLEAAMKAAGPNSVATEAHGSFWLLNVEAKVEDHYGGQHIGQIGPFELPQADQYKMRGDGPWRSYCTTQHFPPAAILAMPHQ